MKIILQSQEKSNKLAELDLTTSEFSVFEKTDYQNKLDFPIRGHFSCLDDILICFFKLDEQFMIKVDDILITLDDKDKVFLRQEDDNHNRFEIERDGKIIFTKVYSCPEISPDISAHQFFNPLISEEDFDIFLFIRNVINNPDRKMRVYKTKNN